MSIFKKKKSMRGMTESRIVPFIGKIGSASGAAFPSAPKPAVKKPLTLEDEITGLNRRMAKRQKELKKFFR